MKKLALFAAALVIGSATRGVAQQAAIPTPPKTVNPTPQPATGCRGCSDDNDVKKKPIEAYDKKPTDSIVKRQAVATKPAASKSTVAKPKPKATASKKRHIKHTVKKLPAKHPLQAKPDTVKKK